MKLSRGNCPYCDAERGEGGAWGMSPEGMAELKKKHDNGHPEHLQANPNYCPNCGFKLTQPLI